MKKNIVLLTTLCLSMILGCGHGIIDDRFSDDPDSWVTQLEEGDLLPEKAVRWNFTDMEGWELANQGNDPIDHSSIEDHSDGDNGKVLRIFTEANTQQRKKVRTTKQYGAGLYTWRTYISDLGELERVSIGSWLWHDDRHELDFEVGSGTSEERAALQLASDEVVAYMTSQANPWVHQKVKIKKNAWHIFQIDLKLVNGKYFATWLIDGVAYATQQLTFGEEYPFYIFCSVENLRFLGDIWPYQDHYGLWDYVEYTPYSYSMEPIIPENPSNPVDPGPEPEEGETILWDFEDGNMPAGWSVWTNVGGDGVGYYGVQDGFMDLSNDGYCITSRATYSNPVGYGKYSWGLRFPPLAGPLKFSAGGTLYTADEAKGYHSITMTGWYGSETERTRLGATGNQLLLRVYSEIPALDRNVAVLDPETDYKLSIELKKVNDKYVIVWLLDDVVLQTANASFGAEEVKFLFITAAESNRAWMPGTDLSQKYTAKFDYIEYIAY